MADKKKAERNNVLLESENKNFVHAILNAVTRGYSDKIVVDDIIELVKSKEISKGVLLAAPEALREYADSFEKSLNFIADEIEDLEVIDELQVKRKQKEQNGEEDDDEYFSDSESRSGDDVVFEDTQFDDIDENKNGEEKLGELPPVKQNIETEENAIEEKAIDEGRKEETTPEVAAADAKIEQQLMQNFKQPEPSTFDKYLDGLTICEDMNKYKYDDKSNAIVGVLEIKMNKDISKNKIANKVDLDAKTIESITKAAFAYLKNEYPRLKAKLDDTIFTSNLVFKDLKTGKAEVKYEIKGAY